MAASAAPISARRTRSARDDAPAARKGVAWPVFVFLLALLVPLIFGLGPVRLSAYRIVLLAMTIPLIFMLFSGKAGKIRFPDYALMTIWGWQALSLTQNHGPDVWIEAAGISFFETLGPYLLARIYIRTPEDFHAMVALMFRILLLLLPFALFEALTSKNIILDVANAVATADDVVAKDPRWGLDRVQGPFSHPILFGVFCGAALALVYKVLGFGRPFAQRMIRTFIAGLTAALSLSSGPLTALVAQVMLLGWEGVMGRIKNHWKLLTCGVVAAIVLVELLSNRSFAEVFISYFAFNARTAYNRILIWDWGSLSVLKNPLFGVGLNEWERAYFMSDSLDMFWLVHAVRGGVLPGILFQALMFWTVLSVSQVKDASARVASYRVGFVACLVGYYLCGWTVHFWNQTYVQFLFMLGAGMWILDWRPSTGDDGGAPAADAKKAPGQERARAVGQGARAAPVGAKLRRSSL